MRPLSALEWLFPATCLSCKLPLAARARLCESCRAALPLTSWPSCVRCALPRPCGSCSAKHAAFDAAFAATAYRGVARRLVLELKRAAAPKLAQLMADQMFERLNACAALAADVTVIPVPTHSDRFAWRGFDHAELLAQALARKMRRPLSTQLRRKQSGRQVGAMRSERLSLPVRITVREPPPAHVMLVDDVYTTGATLDACAHALKRAGSTTVICSVFARTLR